MDSENVPVSFEGSVNTGQSGNNLQLGSAITATESTGLLATIKEMIGGMAEMSKVVKELVDQPDNEELDDDDLLRSDDDAL